MAVKVIIIDTMEVMSLKVQHLGLFEYYGPWKEEI